MILGKIKLEVEYINYKYYFCRPIELANGEEHPRIRGIAHVVYLEKNNLIPNLNRGEEITVYGIFSRKHTIEEFRRGFTNVKVSPVDEETYNRLKQIYNSESHCFEF